MNILEYKGYIAEISFSAEDDIFIGEVVNIRRDKIIFSGSHPREIRKNFKEVVDAYLEDKDMIEEPYSGRITYRTTPQHHALYAKAALLSGKRSLNAFIDDIVFTQASKIVENHHNA